jgi:hypothetical protein
MDGINSMLESLDSWAVVAWADLPPIFDSVAALDMLLLSLLKQVGPGGHTTSHGHPHFSFVGDQVEVRVRQVVERGH